MKVGDIVKIKEGYTGDKSKAIIIAERGRIHVTIAHLDSAKTRFAYRRTLKVINENR